MRRIFRIGTVAALVLLAAGTLQAAELSQKADRLHVSGMLDGSAAREFAGRLQQGGVRVVVFEDALGGSADVAVAYAQAIQAAGVETEVVGQCHAACAYAFLAGRSHRFGEGDQVNALLIPVAARPGAQELGTRWRGDAARQTLAEFTDVDAAAASAVPAASAPSSPARGSRRWQPEHGLLFVSSPTLFGRIYNTYYCDGSQGRDFTRCELLPDADPRQLGIVSD
ncbi:hypothetical protein QTH91_21415 [Variovorax dokdonensis]|uniref:Leucine-binding protein domain-containing protein n=1 Tax=Variovorax dokdonensis TaxID=344883 RepID=A0ABT7NGQ2_9BURK|nr:hypothetical protein [Variovorax dokdonensis]MDM0047065.1 hypothetical protein [Variovorax dokdonensis]